VTTLEYVNLFFNILLTFLILFSMYKDRKFLERYKELNDEFNEKRKVDIDYLKDLAERMNKK
jgi:oligoribonuclease (3'-5' exoribonuclease)